MNRSTTLPIRTGPLTGEGLDSWLERTAARLDVTLWDLLEFIGLPRSAQSVRRAHDIPANRVFLLREAEADAICAATGISQETVHALTLQRYHARAVLIDPVTRRVLVKRLWGRGRASRFCPDCLADTGGAWQLRWRLAWSFACVRHQRLLADYCPRCARPQRHKTSNAPAAPHLGFCANPVDRLNPDTHARFAHAHRRCDADLRAAATPRLPPGHRILAAQAVFDALIETPRAEIGIYADDPQPVITALADARAIAGRVVALATERDIATLLPQDEHTQAVYTLARTELATTTRARQRPGTMSPPDVAASAIALTCAADVLTQPTLAEASAALAWLVNSGRGERARGVYPGGPQEWGRTTSTAFRTVLLGAASATLYAHHQLRYRTSSPHPAPPRPQPPPERAGKIPTLLWPDLYARLRLPPTRNARISLQRPATSAALLLVGTRINFHQALGLLGGAIAHTDLANVLQLQRASPYWPGISTALTRLADYLDATDTPIDYQRRRHLDYSKLLTEREWWRARAAAKVPGVAVRTPRRLLATRAVMCEQLSGLPLRLTPFAPVGDQHPLRREMTHIPLWITPELSHELATVAEAFLQSHGIDEPAVWQPPPNLFDDLDLPDQLPVDIDAGRAHRLLRHENHRIEHTAHELGLSPRTRTSTLLYHHPRPLSPCPLCPEPSG